MEKRICVFILFFCLIFFLLVSCSPKIIKKPSSNATTAKQNSQLNNEIIEHPQLITADYFKKTQGEVKTISLFGGSSEKEKELEKRVEKLEAKLKGLPERKFTASGLPILRRKVVLLSLMGNQGLDVLTLLPEALRKTNGVVPVDAGYLSKLLKDQGLSVSDLTYSSVRRKIATQVGIQAYILVYHPQNTPKLRIDVIDAQQSTLIGSYWTTIDDFNKIAPKISADIVRATQWSCRIVKVDGSKVYLNAGRLSGIRPKDVFFVYGKGKDIIDPITKQFLGYAPGPLKGQIKVELLFGTDASEATIIKGHNISVGDIVREETQ